MIEEIKWVFVKEDSAAGIVCEEYIYQKMENLVALYIMTDTKKFMKLLKKYLTIRLLHVIFKFFS